MASLTRYFALVFVLLGIGWACKDPFMPNIQQNETNVLVVEGYINVGSSAITTIKLSRTTPVTLPGAVSMESKAQVSIVSNTSEEFFLNEQRAGIYVSNALNLTVEKTYKLKIRTSDGKEYNSAFATPIVTPKIDSLNWELQREGLAIFVNTHDDKNATRYYQWEYEETWTNPSVYQSFYYYTDEGMRNRPPQERILMRRCWKHGVSPDLQIASTVALTSDVVSQMRLRFLPIHQDYLDERYSILVKQHALSREAFEYLDIVKKNSVNVGSFTDPQPSQLYGNITSSDTDEMVVGFIQAYTTQEMRIYITASDVPSWRYSLFCTELGIPNNPDSLGKYFGTLGLTPTNGIGTAPNLDGYGAAPPTCVDCRVRGGSTDRPDYWPN